MTIIGIERHTRERDEMDSETRLAIEGWGVYVSMPEVEDHSLFWTEREAMAWCESIRKHYADAYVAVYSPTSLDPVVEYGR
jgi:hypothetical protein